MGILGLCGDMNVNFVKEYLSNVRWNLDNNQWQVSGMIDRVSNEHLKFDIRFLKDFPKDKKGKLIKFHARADKVLFENNKQWILIDTQELMKYIKKHKLKEVRLEELLPNVEWTIVLPKKS